MDLETMMTGALDRRRQAEADVAKMKEERRQERIFAFKQQMDEIFGHDFLSETLGANVHATTEENREPTMHFTYRDRRYSLRDGRWLTRLDSRDDGDERPLPHTEFYTHWRNDGEANRDALLCALSELADWPDTPPIMRTRQEAPRPLSTEELLLDALRGLIRNELSDWRGYQH